MLSNVLNSGLEAIQIFERWSKHDELTPYAEILEEWDDIVGDDWEQPERNFLNPYDWIKENEVYQTHLEKLDEILESAYGKAEDFMESMQVYLQIYWSNNRIDFQMLINERLRNPTDMLVQTTKLFKI